MGVVVCRCVLRFGWGELGFEEWVGLCGVLLYCSVSWVEQDVVCRERWSLVIDVFCGCVVWVGLGMESQLQGEGGVGFWEGVCFVVVMGGV